MRHFLDLLDLMPDEIGHLFQEAARLKAAHARHQPTPVLLGRVLGLVFEKPSLRTRVSFQAAMAQLGGTSLFLSGKEVGLGSRESVPDFARTMSQYVDAVVLRTYSHATVEEFVTHILEKEMLHFEGAKDDKDMRERLKGLGYIS